MLVVDEGDRVNVRPVDLGARRGAEVLVEKGLEAGERVIVRGLQKARPGAPVTPVMAGEETEQTPPPQAG